MSDASQGFTSTREFWAPCVNGAHGTSPCLRRLATRVKNDDDVRILRAQQEGQCNIRLEVCTIPSPVEKEKVFHLSTLPSCSPLLLTWLFPPPALSSGSLGCWPCPPALSWPPESRVATKGTEDMRNVGVMLHRDAGDGPIHGTSEGAVTAQARTANRRHDRIETGTGWYAQTHDMWLDQRIDAHKSFMAVSFGAT